jgi:predicted transcriptional regulator
VKPPCMIVVQYVLPTVRALVMKDLVQQHGMRRIDASKKMELTPAAITQYMKGERGKAFAEQLEKSEKTMRIISEFAEALAKQDIPIDDMISKLCEVCYTVRAEGIICGLHEEESPSLKGSSCDVCGRETCQ